MSSWNVWEGRDEAPDHLRAYNVRARGAVKRALAGAAERGREALHRPEDDPFERALDFERDVHKALLIVVGDGAELLIAIDAAVACRSDDDAAAAMLDAVAFLEVFSKLTGNEARALEELDAQESDLIAAAAENAERAAEAEAIAEIDATPELDHPRLKYVGVEGGRLYVSVPQSWFAPLARIWGALVARPAIALWRVQLLWLPLVGRFVGRILVLIFVGVIVGVILLALAARFDWLRPPPS